MHVVALVNQKGGSGKSTLAACLAVAAREAGERIFLIDMDPQKSLTKWGYRRHDKDLPVEAVSPAKLETALAALLKATGDSRHHRYAGDQLARRRRGDELADLCLIPARPTIFDIWSSEATRGKLKTLGKDYAFVLNQCPAMQESQRVSDGAARARSDGRTFAALRRLARRLSGSCARRHGVTESIRGQGRRRNAPALGVAETPACAPASTPTNLRAGAPQLLRDGSIRCEIASSAQPPTTVVMI